MTEMFFALAVILLAVCGLGAGLLLGRGAPQSSCGASACRDDSACDTCPLRRAGEGRP